MAEKDKNHEKKPGEEKLGEPFKPIKKGKVAEVVAAMGEKLTEVIKTLNANTKMANERFENLQSNQTELTKILAQMRQNPFAAGPGSGGPGGISAKEKMTYGIIDLVLRGDESTPMDQAFKMAESFNKIYMTGQSNMLKTIHLLTKRGGVADLFDDKDEQK